MEISAKKDRKIIIVLQSRLSSKRLPGKALLPINGIPILLLSAMRASNTGLNLVVATSNQPIDDPIADTLKKANIAYFRGSEDDVLRRFVMATQHLNQNDIVVRLTADNVLPDGKFIQSLLDQFIEANVDYLGTSSPVDSLPYGMSGEVFTVEVLRKADTEATSAFDREHVTALIRRDSKTKIFDSKKSSPHWSKLRCTIDNFEDYYQITKLFHEEMSPVSVSWQKLVSRLEAAAPYKKPRCPFKVMADGSVHSELTLGTVQLGISYGIANTIGLPTVAKSKELLQMAIDAGITSIDTARAYGESEARVGELLSPRYKERVGIITKLDVLAELTDTQEATLITKLVDESIYHSLHNLQTERLHTVLLHRWEHYYKYSGVIWQRLLAFKNLGTISKLGVSVSNPTEAIEALKDQNITHIQLPINILDWRWRSSDFLTAVSARSDVVLHARSVLLQGLITMEADSWPKISNVEVTVLISQLDEFVKKFERKSRADLCIAYVRSIPWVTSLVIGMEDLTQLNMNLDYFQSSALTLAQQYEIDIAVSNVPMDLLNPSTWRNYQ